jgi:hypothetical protein
MAKRAEAEAAGRDKKEEKKQDDENTEIKEDEEEYKFDFEKEKEPSLCLSDVTFGSLTNLLKAIEDVKPSKGADAGNEFNRSHATITSLVRMLSAGDKVMEPCISPLNKQVPHTTY